MCAQNHWCEICRRSLCRCKRHWVGWARRRRFGCVHRAMGRCCANASYAKDQVAFVGRIAGKREDRKKVKRELAATCVRKSLDPPSRWRISHSGDRQQTDEKRALIAERPSV